jgi:3-oxoacyl-[acyl-carrier-protein] synthase-3
VIGNATRNGHVSITGIGAYAPQRVMKNDELAQIVDTSDEWIVERTGIRERRVASPDEALSDLALPAAKDALQQAGLQPSSVDLIVVATVTPDMLFPSTGAILADQLGAKDAAAYDLSAGCTGFVYALVQAHGMVASGLVDHALVVGGDVLSKIVDWEDRSTCVLFGDGAGAVVLERVPEGGFLGFELGADGSGGPQLYMPAGGSRAPATAETVARRLVREGARRMRCACRGNRRLRASPGERAHHRPRTEEARNSRRAHGGQRRPLRQHFVWLDSARARRRRVRRTAQGR